MDKNIINLSMYPFNSIFVCFYLLVYLSYPGRSITINIVGVGEPTISANNLQSQKPAPTEVSRSIDRQGYDIVSAGLGIIIFLCDRPDRILSSGPAFKKIYLPQLSGGFQ
jgi:hypothetical protein